VTQKIQNRGLIAIAFTTALLMVASYRFLRKPDPFILGVVLAVGIQSMAAFWGLLWALPKSNRAFFSIFVSDSLLRLVGLGLATYWLWSRHLPFTGPLLILAFAYLLLSLVQIPFLYKVSG
jgi:hypothetical protein